jgi:hypothetical protein
MPCLEQGLADVQNDVSFGDARGLKIAAVKGKQILAPVHYKGRQCEPKSHGLPVLSCFAKPQCALQWGGA